MRKQFSILILLLFILLGSLWGQIKEMSLSREQKLKDFSFLYESLKENYPFFEVQKRKNGFDWLANKKVYEKKIAQTKTNSTYFFTIQEILNELENPHVNLNPTIERDLYINTYRNAVNFKPKYERWYSILEKSESNTKYWQNVWFASKRNNNFNQFKQEKSKTSENIETLFFQKESIAVIRIKSFMFSNIEKDKAKIKSFVKEIENYKFIIIDIQGNSGGSSNYWSRYLVPYFTSKSINFYRIFAIKKGKLNKYYYPNCFETDFSVFSNLENKSQELTVDFYSIFKSQDTVHSKSSKNLKGKIFLLVNEEVVSASEDFAYFCKVSKWAKVVGTTTLGDGICGEPVLLRLPESGIVISYPALVGLNPDGTWNFETKTVPDIYIGGKDSRERLKNFITYIKKCSRKSP